MPLLAESQLSSLPHDTVLRGRLRPDLGPDAPEVVAALAAWPARAYLATDEDGTEVVLVYQLKAARPRTFPWVHVLLLLATVVTTLGAGALMAGEVLDTRNTRRLDSGLSLVVGEGVGVGASSAIASSSTRRVSSSGASGGTDSSGPKESLSEPSAASSRLALASSA